MPSAVQTRLVKYGYKNNAARDEEKKTHLYTHYTVKCVSFAKYEVDERLERYKMIILY